MFWRLMMLFFIEIEVFVIGLKYGVGFDKGVGGVNEEWGRGIGE